MKSPRMNNHGLTLAELILTAALIGGVILVVVQLIRVSTIYFKRIEVRQTMTNEGRTCMNMIVQALRKGKAKSVRISTVNAVPMSPNSRIDFELVDTMASGTTAYTIFWRDRTVYIQNYPPAGGSEPKGLAKNVTGLMFTGDSRDPSIIRVSLRMDAPLDASNTANRGATTVIPNEEVRLKTKQ